MISVVIPIHNEEGNIEPLYQELKEVLEGLGEDYELIYVNDGSTDRSGEILATLKARDPRVRVLEMDRNRGEAAALTAGFWHARGDVVVSLDGDGQNNPAYIPELLRKLSEGYLVVSGWRRKRKEPFFRRVLPSWVANRLIGLVTGVRVRDNGCSLKVYRAEVVRRVQLPYGFHRFIPAVFGVRNEEVAEVPILDRPRRFGRSHYGLSRIFEVVRELLTMPFLRKARVWREVLLLLGMAELLSGGLSLVGKEKKGFFLLMAGSCSLVISANLSRFLRAQEKGVFRVREL